MPRYVALLRAVNVGKRTVAMAKLRAVVEELGGTDVRTHINSGNVAFTSRAKAASLETKLEAAFAGAFGFDVPTYVRTISELAHSAELEPFAGVADDHVYLVAFVRSTITAAQRKAVLAMATSVDDLAVDGREIHWHIHGKSMDSQIADKQWKATGVGPTTTRNIRMLRKMVAKES